MMSLVNLHKEPWGNHASLIQLAVMLLQKKGVADVGSQADTSTGI